jgi:hypothetical protein
MSFLFNTHCPDRCRRLSASSSGRCHFLITRHSSYLKMAKINVKLNVDRCGFSNEYNKMLKSLKVKKLFTPRNAQRITRRLHDCGIVILCALRGINSFLTFKDFNILLYSLLKPHVSTFNLTSILAIFKYDECLVIKWQRPEDDADKRRHLSGQWVLNKNDILVHCLVIVVIIVTECVAFIPVQSTAVGTRVAAVKFCSEVRVQ